MAVAALVPPSGPLSSSSLMKSSRHSDRVRFLSTQIVKLRKADEAYQKKRFPSPREVRAHERRADRLFEILGELAYLNSKANAAPKTTKLAVFRASFD
jgi:hypothetical protein